VELDVAILDVKPGKEIEFEREFGKAERIIPAVPGYLRYQECSTIHLIL
jgi:heme-degrading monooxygenase HmoA